MSNKEVSTIEPFDEQLQSLSQEIVQDWPSVLEKAVLEAASDFKDKWFSGTVFVSGGALLSAIPLTGLAESIAVGISSGTIVMMYGGSLIADLFSIENKFLTKRAYIPKPRKISVAMKMAPDASLFALVKDPCYMHPIAEIFLGKDNQEEIARRFLMIQQMCVEATEKNAQGPSKELLAKYNLRRNGKFITAPKRQSKSERELLSQEQINQQKQEQIAQQYEQEEQKLLLAANQKLMDALHDKK